MSRRTPLRIRIDDRGILEIVDPSWDCIELLRTFDPEYTPNRTQLKGLSGPRFIQLHRIGSTLSKTELIKSSDDALWTQHAKLREGTQYTTLPDDEASVLDVKIELARRALSHCTLCAQRCGVDRLSGQRGVCRLGPEARVAEHFVHIAEESPVNPSLLVSLMGCGLRCRYCQQHGILNPMATEGEALTGSLWETLDTQGARSLSFAGGNPDESLYAILRFLNDAPRNWELPIVWNCHGAASTEAISLLDGIVDLWLPDLKYGDDTCARQLAGITHYTDTALSGIDRMLAQAIPVIVRILVLPGHLKCCHYPVLERLKTLNHQDNLYVSIRGQYCPDWKIRPEQSPLNRRPSIDEIAAVRDCADKLGLKLIS